MALRFRAAWTPEPPAGDWDLPGRPGFAESTAFQRLFQDLRRYVHDEVAGRSFLVAGHRGAGKTATVAEAIRRLHADSLRNSGDPKGPLGRLARLQRPLVVKLVGQSLIAPPPRQREIEDQEAEARVAAGTGATPPEVPAPVTGEGAQNQDQATAGKGDDHVENALVHITIALYRAFASEVAQGFARHAARSRPRDLADRLELASQLALELDGGPEPALLRSYWERLGRLEAGVLWPARTDQTMQARQLHRQGMREIVAIATAAQAFQVCSGAVTYKVTNQETATDERTLETKLDIKDLLNRLGALGAGALAGSVVGSDSGAVQGVATGLLVWLASGLTLDWTGRRYRKSDRTLDYTFLRDRSIQTLDRELPLMIERIRDAGLAPVFVIDELDKLDNPTGEIKDIISRLKHLVADYGFFCFLTDRGYFDEIERKVANRDYPTEHTYFSQRVLVLNRPADLLKYVQGLLTPAQPTPAESLAIATFALAVIYRSKLNFTDMSRELARYTADNGDLALSVEDLQRSAVFQLDATIQLAIDQVLLDRPMEARFDGDSAFEHLVVDALYYIPLCWEKNVAAVADIRDVALKPYLLDRRKSRSPDNHRTAEKKAAEGADDQEQADQAGAAGNDAGKDDIDPADMDDLLDLVWRVANYLGDFRALAEMVRLRSGEASTHADIVSSANLLVPAEDEGPGRFRFTLDESAQSRLMLVPEAVSEAEPERPEELLEEISELIALAGLTIDNLVFSRVLPGTLTETQLRTAIEDLKAAAADPESPFAPRGVEAREIFARAFNSHGARLADSLFLLADVADRFGIGDPRRRVLSRMSRYFGLDAGRIRPENAPPLPDVAMTGTAQSVRDCIAAYRAFLEQPPAEKPTFANPPPAETWELWRLRLRGYLSRSQLPTLRLDYMDLALAAQDLPPGKLFRADLSAMDLIDWSEAALAALPVEDAGQAPPWLLYAALKALDFGQEAMQFVYAQPTPLLPMNDSDRETIEELIRTATPGRPRGILYVYANAARLPLAIPRAAPLLAIGRNQLAAHMSGLNRLADHDLFEGGITNAEQ